MTRFDVAVIGGGIMGAPAAHHLAQLGASVAAVASPEPADERTHAGPFAAHYDVSRLVWRSHMDPIETRLSELSAEMLTEIDDIAQGTVLGRPGCLFVSAPGRDEGRLAVASSEGVEILDTASLTRQFPFLSFPHDVVGFYESNVLGTLNPRRVVASELQRAAASGATVLSTHATRITPGPVFTIDLATGESIEADRVLVAAGGFTNELLSTPLALRMKEESVLLARLSDEDAEALADYPPLVYQLAAGAISDVYSSPPTRYPDGHTYLKWGANTVADRWLSSDADIRHWYRAGDSDSSASHIRSHLLETVPGIEPTGWASHRCAVTYTATGMPYIDQIDEGLFVATGGNGHSAKWSPILGLMAAELVSTGAWSADVPRHAFSAVMSGHETEWKIRDLWSERVGAP